MLSILTLLLVIVFLTILRKKIVKSRILSFLNIALINLLILETIIYALLIGQVIRDDSFFLIGNQKFLNKLIKSRVVDTLYINQNSHNNYFQVDNNSGYTLGKSKHHQIFHTNSHGLRGTKEYSLLPNDNILRMGAFGDSFIFGDGEPYANIWPTFLEKSVGNFEVLNFGVSGYGLGQTYLRYMRDGIKFHPDIVLFNYILLGSRDRVDPKDAVARHSLKRSTLYRVHFWLDKGVLKSKSITPFDLFNDQLRNQLIYKPLGINYDKLVWSNKVFSILNVGLFVKQIALKNIINDAKLIDNKQELLVNLKLIDNLIKQVKKNNAKLIFFYGNDFKDLPTDIQNLLLSHTPTITYVNSSKLLDMRFKHYGVTKKQLLNSTKHYNARGQMIYAETIAAILKNRVWGKGNRTFKHDSQTNSFIN